MQQLPSMFFFNANIQDTSTGADLVEYVPCWYPSHPVLVTNRLSSLVSWRNFVSGGSSPVACADRKCTTVTKRGVDPKGHICPLVATLCTLRAWVLARGRLGSLRRSKLLGAAGVWAEPPLSIACPATGFPCCDWLLSLVLAEVCLAAVPGALQLEGNHLCGPDYKYSHRSCASQSPSLRIPFPAPVASWRIQPAMPTEAASLSSPEWPGAPAQHATSPHVGT